MKWVIYVYICYPFWVQTERYSSFTFQRQSKRFHDKLYVYICNLFVIIIYSTFANKLKMARADLSCGETCEVTPQQLIVVIQTFMVSINKLSLTLLRLT